MTTIMLTGSNGQLGIALNKELSKVPDIKIINTDIAELDICNLDSVLYFINQNRPDIIINCAAHTAVDLCEKEENRAFLINAIGPRNLAIAANSIDATIVHVSTDYVFSGEDNKRYNEFDSVNPQSAYGRTKLRGEEFVKAFSNKYFILRTAWLYGEGNNFVKTMLRLAESHDEVSVVSDQYGSPTSAKELARVIASLINTSQYGTYHATCEGECSWSDFAREIFRLTEKSTKVNDISTAEYNAPAKRPAYSVLDNYMLDNTTDIRFKNWQDALVEYIDNI